MVSRVVRISTGHFDPDKMPLVRKALENSFNKLAPGIRSMKGNIDYFVGLDTENYAMVNASSWDSISSAKQMEQFQPMQELAREFIGMGVRFDQPILNFEPVWTIDA